MENHDLYHEFPEMHDAIHELKVTNEHFKKLYDEYIEYLKKQLSSKEFKKKMKEIKLGFILAVSGDYESCNERIILDEDWEEEEDKN